MNNLGELVCTRALSRRALLAISTVLVSGLAAPALAQFTPGDRPSEYQVDENGVDLPTGGRPESSIDLSIGGSGRELALVRTIDQTYGLSGSFFNYAISLVPEPNGDMQIQVGDLTKRFIRKSGSTYENADGTGETLNGEIYTDRDGVRYVFGFGTGDNENNNILYRATEIVYPDGSKTEIRWTYDVYRFGENNNDTSYYDRIEYVRNSSGYLLRFRYAVDNFNSGLPDPAYQQIVRVTAINTADMPCDEANAYCRDLVGDWPTVTYARTGDHLTGSLEVSGPGDAIKRYSWILNQAGIERTLEADGHKVVVRPQPRPQGSSVVNKFDLTVDGVTSTYTYTAPQGYPANALTVTSPGRATRSYTIENERVRSATAEGRTSSFAYDAKNRLGKVTSPEGNATEYAHDARGNRTEVRIKSKPNSGVADIVTSAGFPTDCVNAVSCNKPQWTEDGRRARTDYAHDPITGLPTSMTLPAGRNGVRPQTRYVYDAAAGVPGVKLLRSVSTCATQTSCAGTADEAVTTFSYGANLLPATTITRGGDNSVSATASVEYDRLGDVRTSRSPLGTAGDSYFRYDARRRLIGEISPDPDGAGPRKRRARRVVFTADRVTLVEDGTINGVTESDWGSFASAQQSSSSYDVNGRLAKSVASAGGAIYQVVQYGYDQAGKLECTAQRLNPAEWSSLPVSACDADVAGQDGPDRIARTQHDALGRVAKVTSGLQTTAVADEVTYTYTGNGLPETATDANGNATRYDYDGVDRLERIRYPVPAVGARASSTTDREEFTYDPGGNVTSKLLRNGERRDFDYDALNRLVGGSAPGITLGYDLLGRLTSATRSGGASVSYGYDALGRRVREDQPQGTLTSAYDAAGRRTRLTWADGFFVTYEHQNTGEMTAIRQSGTELLAGFGYDDLGRRSSLTRGNGQSTGYKYDDTSRLVEISDLTGRTQAIKSTLTYGAADQIKQLSRSNDIYTWPNKANGTQSYSINGLNQYVAVGGAGLTYDTLGNLQGSGGNSYQYTADNLLGQATVAGRSTTFSYDGVGRLLGTDANGQSYRFLYDGPDLVGEYAAGALQRRYIHGPGDDEPLVWFEGGQKRWIHSDERGSAIAISDAGGTVLATNTYDEYGMPAAGNIGRFQYTGQAWLPEVALYNYKARMYSPVLGRFMQTDPIGYSDGMNWYEYAGGDPVNMVDPTGLAGCVPAAPGEILVCAKRISRSGGAGGGSGNYGIMQDEIDRQRSADQRRSRRNPNLKPQNVARTRICRAGKLLAELADFATDVGLGVAGAGAAVGGATGGLPGAMAGATPGLTVAGGGGATSAVGNLAMDLAGRNYSQGAVRFALNFGGGKVISRLSDAGRIGSFLSPSTRKFIADAYGEVAGAVTGMAFSPDSPVNCEAIQ